MKGDDNLKNFTIIRIKYSSMGESEYFLKGNEDMMPHDKDFIEKEEIRVKLD